jgi:hypothetical protein
MYSLHVWQKETLAVVVKVAAGWVGESGKGRMDTADPLSLIFLNNGRGEGWEGKNIQTKK